MICGDEQKNENGVWVSPSKGVSSAEQDFLADDNNLALWFTPDAIRDHFEYDPRVTLASDERLRRVGLDALQADYIYEAFHDALVAALENEGIRA